MAAEIASTRPIEATMTEMTDKAAPKKAAPKKNKDGLEPGSVVEYSTMMEIKAKHRQAAKKTK